ncbi:MAG: HAMP domain-containing protein [Betaproteobacteria bacterium]|nr:HAMP domain-containing protein [Betaproteobacteria bacterium]
MGLRLRIRSGRGQGVRGLPRTLAARAFLLIAILLVVSLAVSAEIFRRSEQAPRARQLAQMVVSVVNLTRAAVLSADPALRPALLAELAESEGIRVFPAEIDETVAALPLDRPVARLMTEEVRSQLGAATRFGLSRNGAEGFWVSFFIGDEEFWVMLPRERIERPRALQWLGWGALVLLLALAGAWLIARQVGRPLRTLASAAAAVGQGATPPPVPETGPGEVQTVAKAFNQMSRDLEQMNSDRVMILAGISHDLRTPLARLRLGVEMSRADAATRDGMAADIEEMDGVISQFLDFARDERSEAAGAADLNGIVAEVAERYGRRGQHVDTRLGALPAMTLRPLAIQRLVSNLVDNALRHGGSPVEVRTAQQGDAAVLRVLDRGPGIPRDEAARMLRPFTRMDSARGGAGTGLGLAIVERIARMHGGAIRLISRDGGGLEARVELPLSPV